MQAYEIELFLLSNPAMDYQIFHFLCQPLTLSSSKPKWIVNCSWKNNCRSCLKKNRFDPPQSVAYRIRLLHFWWATLYRSPLDHSIRWIAKEMVNYWLLKVKNYILSSGQVYSMTRPVMATKLVMRNKILVMLENFYNIYFSKNLSDRQWMWNINNCSCMNSSCNQMTPFDSICFFVWHNSHFDLERSVWMNPLLFGPVQWAKPAFLGQGVDLRSLKWMKRFECMRQIRF